jgi:hypothetical protein
MAKTTPWHAIRSEVHHNNTGCYDGNNLERDNRREGRGKTRRLCATCRQLNKRRT